MYMLNVQPQRELVHLPGKVRRDLQIYNLFKLRGKGRERVLLIICTCSYCKAKCDNLYNLGILISCIHSAMLCKLLKIVYG